MERLLKFLKEENGHAVAEWGLVFGVAVAVILYFKMKSETVTVGQDWM